MKHLYLTIGVVACMTTHITTNAQMVNSEIEAPVFITIGQSNADGSAFFDTDEDARLKAWYETEHGTMKMYYRSCKVQNQKSNALGEAARWTIDDTADVEPGWLDLWYRNENKQGRTAMNMIHSYGTSSTGTNTSCAQGRRGMEGQFGVTYREAFPDKDLYMVKLGVSGSFISSWSHPDDNTNWIYFYNKIYKPAIEELLEQGKRPILAGIWWMQGCADTGKTQDYYDEWLTKLIDNCRSELGFDDAYFYIGHIVKPGESTDYPKASVSFSQNVRDAQEAVAERMDRVVTVDTKDCAFQYESAFAGYLHFSHKGVNKIGEILATDVAARGADDWTPFSTPGYWTETTDGAIFTPTIGNPTITYSQENGSVIATLTYPGWSETKRYDSESSVSEIRIDSDSTITYYNLQGIPTDKANRVPGIYISRQGNKVAKIAVR